MIFIFYSEIILKFLFEIIFQIPLIKSLIDSYSILSSFQYVKTGPFQFNKAIVEDEIWKITLQRTCIVKIEKISWMSLFIGYSRISLSDEKVVKSSIG